MEVMELITRQLQDNGVLPKPRKRIAVTYIPSETEFYLYKSEYFNGFEIFPKVEVSDEAPF